MPSSSIYVSQNTMWKRMQNKVGTKLTQPKPHPYGIAPSETDATITQGKYDEKRWDERATFAPSQRLGRWDGEGTFRENAEIGTAQQGHRRQASSVYSQAPTLSPKLPQHTGFPTSRYPNANTQASANFQDKVRNYENEVEISPRSSPELTPLRGAGDRLPQDSPSTNALPRDDFSFMPSSPPLRLPPTQTRAQRMEGGSQIPVPRRNNNLYQHQGRTQGARPNSVARKQVPQNMGIRAVSASSTTYNPYGGPGQTRPGYNEPPKQGTGSAKLDQKLKEAEWETCTSLASQANDATYTEDSKYFNEDDRPVTKWAGSAEETVTHAPTVTNLEREFGAPYAKQPTQSLGDKVRKMRENAIPGGKRVVTSPSTMGNGVGERPQWKGASGRQAVVPIPQDNPYVATLQIPRKSSKRVPSLLSVPGMNSSRAHAPAAGTPRMESPLAKAGDMGYFPDQGQGHPPRTTSASAAATSGKAKYDGKYDEKYEDRFNTSPASSLDSLPSQQHPAMRSASNLNPTSQQPEPQSQPPRRGGIPPSVSTIERNFERALADVHISTMPNLQQHTQPTYPNEVSRFSVTTYAASTMTANSTPRASIDSEAPPVPDIGSSIYLQNAYARADPSHSAILNRRRPVGQSSYAFDKTSAEMERPPALGPDGAPTVVKVHVRDTSKALPKSPLELGMSDKAAQLEAHLQDLALQMRNLDRSIEAMTKLQVGEMTGIGLNATAEQRKAEVERRGRERKKVEGLREELGRVKGEEHEIGLKLHRVLKKRDSEATYEPTGLWVRRVTG